MKKMMLALAALCVAGAATAVTVAWSEGYDSSKWSEPTGWNSITGATGNTDKLSGNVTFTIDVSALLTKFGIEEGEKLVISSVLLLGRNDYRSGDENFRQPTQITFTKDGSNLTATNANQVGTVNSDIPVHEFTFSDGKLEIAYGTTGPITVKVDGGYGVVKPDGDSSGIVSNFSDSWNAGIGFAGEVVPEPTALALLALGVAGLALRRKAA